MTTSILITGALHSDAISSFEQNPDFSVVYKPDCKRDDLLKLVKKTTVLVTRSETKIDKELIDLAPDLKVIARAAVGVGNIDVDYATDRGILVINCPGKNTNSAAELTFALLLSMLRKLPTAYAHLKQGGWDRHEFSGRELKGKKLGIVGLGNVGHRVAKFAHGFDMEVFAYDPYVAQDVFRRNGATRVEKLTDLASQVDILSVHVPLNKETRGMVDSHVIDHMKDGSYVLNAARGGICVEDDLINALDKGKLAGVALDTFENEPEPLKKLIDHKHVWCTQHIGASTLEAQQLIGETIYDQVVKAADGGVVDYPVNLPDIGIPDNSMLKAYSVLSQKLGSLIAQLIDFNPDQMEVSYRGDLANFDTSLVRLGLMKGYAGHVVDAYVSFVNTTSHFERLGIKLIENDDPDFESYKSAVKVVVRGDEGKTLSVGGIVFDSSIPKISLINEFYFEIDPQGLLIITENLDRPGVIGDIGHYLAKEKVNIDNFTLSRNRQGGKAMAVIRTDTDLDAEQLKKLSEIENVVKAKAVRL